MITIDLVDEYTIKTEKPQVQAQSFAAGSWHRPLDPAYNLARSRHNDLLRAAHNARLVKANRGEEVAVDVQRYAEGKGEVITLVERYVRRARKLAFGNGR